VSTSAIIKFTVVVIIAILLALFDHLRKRNVARKKYKLPDEIKNRYKKILVHPEEVKILTNEYYEEEINDEYDKVKSIDALYHPNRNYRQIRKFASVIVYYFNSKGKQYRFRSETIDLSPEELDYELKIHGMLDFYFDEKNLKNHYFDLSFLACKNI
jgi:hypothetical protein